MQPFFVSLLSLLSASPPGKVSPGAAFDRWIRDQGIRSNARVEDFAAAGGGRGLIALQSIDQGGVVVKVPLTATLRVTGGWDENDGWAGVLAHMLLTQKELGVAATHGPYIQLGLPSEAPMTPCRWTEAELLQLQNTTFISEVQQNKIWRREQQHVHRSHGEANDDDAYLTMLDLVCSRTLKGRDNSRQLVPLIDIANHAPSESGGGSFKVDHNSVYLLAGHGGIKAGQAVTLDYGARTVEDFLLHYGFVPDRCRSDSVRIGQHCITWMDCAYRGHSDPRVRDACKEILNGFPTSMKEDLDLLNSMEKEAEAFRLALHYRFAKKSLLAAAAGIPVYG